LSHDAARPKLGSIKTASRSIAQHRAASRSIAQHRAASRSIAQHRAALRDNNFCWYKQDLTFHASVSRTEDPVLNFRRGIEKVLFGANIAVKLCM
jgi:hypothetical protein